MSNSVVYSHCSVLDFFEQPSGIVSNPPANYVREYFLTNGQQILLNSAGSFLPSYGPGGTPTMPNASIAQILASNIGTGDIDLYTVPTGKRALAEVQVWNSTASSITYYPEIKIGSTYYAIGSKQTLANTTTENNNAFVTYTIVFEAGQKVALNTTGSGLNVVGVVYLFDTSSNLKSSAITSFINGDNTVYTCPAGKTANLAHGPAALVCTAATVPAVFGVNNTATTITYKWNMVTSGGTPGTSNQITIAVAANATSGTPIAFGRNMPFGFTAGDFASVNSTANTAGQIAWVNVVEQTL